MKLLPARRALAALLIVAAILAAFVAVASLPWRAERARTPPRLVASAHGTGGLSAGAGEARFALPAETPIGGFPRMSYASDGVADPVGARALVLASPGCSVAIVSTEILLVPETLDAAVRERVADLGLTGIVVAATHTHAGPGGFWKHAVGERIATGPYDAGIEEAIVRAIADAIRAAAGALAPARAYVGRGSADDLARSRSGGLEAAPLTVLRVDRPDGTPVAELTVFGAHPTIVRRSNRTISGDWPGSFLSRNGRGLRLFVQGAVGDQSCDGPAATSADAYASAVSERVRSIRFGPPDASPPLALATVEATLPPVEPGAVPAFLRRAARTVASHALPATARVQAVRIGSAVLVAIPGEPVASVAEAWRRRLPDGATVLSLTGGYVGYVEEPHRMARRSGETVRTYYGPELSERLGEAIAVAVRTTVSPPAP